MARHSFFRQLRVAFLLYVLLFVAVGSWLARARTTDWDDTLYVGVYPVNGDRSAVAADYIDDLEAEDFADVEQFIAREAARYGIRIANPVTIEMGTPVEEMPPAPPQSRNPIRVVFWSLALRYWDWRMQRHQSGPDPDIRVYFVVFDPQKNPVVAHSLGLQKGLIGVVNGFASARLTGSNNVVLTHELLHTVGASDKYDPATTQPLLPLGYAEPQKQPLYPQRYAEIMGGRIPLTPTSSEIPRSLDEVMVGPATALEIRWVR